MNLHTLLLLILCNLTFLFIFLFSKTETNLWILRYIILKVKLLLIRYPQRWQSANAWTNLSTLLIRLNRLRCVTVGALKIRGPRYRGHKIWNTELILLRCFILRWVEKRVPIYCWADKESFQLTPSPVFKLPTVCTNIKLPCVQIYLSLIITNEMCSLVRKCALYIPQHTWHFLFWKKKNTVNLYSINKVNKVFKLILMQKMICLSLEIIFSQLVLEYILISYLHIIYNVIIFSCMLYLSTYRLYFFLLKI